MTKQVLATAAAAITVAAAAPKNLYLTVVTTDASGAQIGHRIVDLFHIGTRNWMSNHQWWAAHNNNRVEIRNSDESEIASYLAESKVKLAEKFNKAA